ncbi:uncharacterized protein LOC119578780 isoform X1 [Penaeus monodon]|uniref:uncharacterized protein LOC119578780 isoform X1 n=1 Tax=Penaeus monodon TaxID=6687 RepID=UPI0018A719F3|nr:uncharacterized protein LOC119578780 isoform X1 [Penaeus monodon]
MDRYRRLGSSRIRATLLSGSRRRSQPPTPSCLSTTVRSTVSPSSARGARNPATRTTRPSQLRSCRCRGRSTRTTTPARWATGTLRATQLRCRDNSSSACKDSPTDSMATSRGSRAWLESPPGKASRSHSSPPARWLSCSSRHLWWAPTPCNNSSCRVPTSWAAPPAPWCSKGSVGDAAEGPPPSPPPPSPDGGSITRCHTKLL